MIAKTGDSHPVVAVLAAVPRAEPMSWRTPITEKFPTDKPCFGFLCMNKAWRWYNPHCGSMYACEECFNRVWAGEN